MTCRAGHGARRRALGAGTSLDLSQRRGAPPSGARPRSGRRPPRPFHRAGASCRRPPRSACDCWSGPSGGGCRLVARAARRRRPSDARASMPPPSAWCTAKGTASRRSWWTATTAGSSPRSFLPAWRRCGSRSSTRCVTLSEPEGILLRHDVPARRRERLPDAVEPVVGSVPRQIEVREGAVRYLAAPWDGQKTGAFLDQRPNRLLAGVGDATRWACARLLRLPRLLRPPPGRPRGGR